MAQTTDTAPKWDDLTAHIAVHTPIQAASRCVDGGGSDAGGGVFMPKVSQPWAQLFPSQAQNIFSFNAADSGFGAQTSPDYDKKLLEWQASSGANPQPTNDWVPNTPKNDEPSTTTTTTTTTWDAPTGVQRPEPHKAEPVVEVDVVDVRTDSSREESPIDVLTNSAFTPVLDKPEDTDGHIVRPTPLRMDSVESNGHLLQQPNGTDDEAAAFAVPSAGEAAGPSSAESTPSSAVPPTGCFLRPPGLGPPTMQEPDANGSSGSSGYICAVCGFSCASKFHYNSHMNTHGDHQCAMCDYTSRTEGRLKKHMRESHTIEEQLAAGLELSPIASHTPASNNASPQKEEPDSLVPLHEVATSTAESLPLPRIPSPQTLSSALFGMIATSSANTTSALDQMRAITEKSLIHDGNGLLLMGNPLAMITPTGTPSGRREERRGKVKQYKCKQCPYISNTKEQQWEHARTHIPSDKQLDCPKCKFVTEYKHHLEYHIRNHLGSKPFQCKKCAYTCVNKSMLNSHMKSHTNIYQFRCSDCTYATKYCHSLKQHLKKYGHRRRTDGLEDLSVGPPTGGEMDAVNGQARKDSNVSIASSLSGPFTPYSIKREDSSFSFPGVKKEDNPLSPLSTPTMPSFPMSLAGPMATTQSLNYATQMLLRQHQLEQMLSLNNMTQQLQQAAPSFKCSMCEFSCRSHEDLVRHNMGHLLGSSALYSLTGLPAGLNISDRSGEDDDTTGSPPGDDAVSHSNGSSGSPIGSGRGSGDEAESGSNGRRKGKACRIDEIGQRLRDKASPDTLETKQEPMDLEEATATATIISHPDHQLTLPPANDGHSSSQQQQQHQQTNGEAQQSQQQVSNGLGVLQQAYLAHLVSQSQPQWRYECTHCRMGFQDEALHQIHMGYHGYDNVFQCNRCGHAAHSPLAFNLHLLQSSHL